MRRDWELDLVWNIKLFFLVYNNRHPYLDKFYLIFYHMGKGYSLPLFLLLFYYLKLSFWPILLSLLIISIIIPIIKLIFRHYRPARLFDKVTNFEGLQSRSFPSADAGYAMTLFGITLFTLHPIWQILFFIYAVIISYGRMYMGAHFPLDILTGTIISLITVSLVYYFL